MEIRKWNKLYLLYHIYSAFEMTQVKKGLGRGILRYANSQPASEVWIVQTVIVRITNCPHTLPKGTAWPRVRLGAQPLSSARQPLRALSCQTPTLSCQPSKRLAVLLSGLRSGLRLIADVIGRVRLHSFLRGKMDFEYHFTNEKGENLLLVKVDDNYFWSNELGKSVRHLVMFIGVVTCPIYMYIQVCWCTGVQLCPAHLYVQDVYITNSPLIVFVCLL